MAGLNSTLTKIVVKTGPIIAEKAVPLAGGALEVAWTGITTAATVVAPLAPVLSRRLNTFTPFGQRLLVASPH